MIPDIFHLVSYQLTVVAIYPHMVSHYSYFTDMIIVIDEEQVTIYFLKDITSGKKKSKFHLSYYLSEYCAAGIKSKEARHIYVPHYESLTIKKILEFLDDDHNLVFNYLPDLRELDKISREWICNICSSVL